MKRILFICIAVILSGSVYAQNDIASAQAGVDYGQGVSGNKFLNLKQLESKLQKDSVYKGSLSGEIVEVCVKKGCFMKLVDGKKDEVVTVRFKDYGFFMPQDIVGKKVALEGEAKVTEHSVKQLQHWAEDAGKRAEEIAAITAPKRTIEFVATGVKVLN